MALSSTQLVKERKITSLFQLLKLRSRKKVKKVWRKIKKKPKSKKHNSSDTTSTAAPTTNVTTKITATSDITADAITYMKTKVINDTDLMIKETDSHSTDTKLSASTTSKDEEREDLTIKHDNKANSSTSFLSLSSSLSSKNDIINDNKTLSSKIMQKFLQINLSAIKRIESVDNVLVSVAKTNKKDTDNETDVYYKNNSLLEYEDGINNQISLIKEEWNKMKQMYTVEANKRKSRLTVDDIETQHALLLQLRDRIYNIPIRDGIVQDLDIDNAPITPTSSPMITDSKSLFSNTDNINKYSPLTPTTVSKETLRAEEVCKPIELDYGDDWWTETDQERDGRKCDKESELKLLNVDGVFNSIHSMAMEKKKEVRKDSDVIADVHGL